MRLTTSELALRAVKRWVHFYTWGLPADLGDGRRAEIESDLWEQERDSKRAGQSDGVAAWDTLHRLARGIPADMAWRIDRTLTSRHEGQERGLMNEPKGQTAFVGIARLMAAFTVIVGVSVSLGMFESHVDGHDMPRFLWGIVGVSAGVMVLVGLSVGRRLPILGDVFVIIGAFPLAAILVWTIFLPALWLLLVMFLLIRGRRLAFT